MEAPSTFTRHDMQQLVDAGAFPEPPRRSPSWRENLAALGISLVAFSICACAFLVGSR